MIVATQNKGEISIQVAGKTGTKKTMMRMMTGKTGMKKKMMIKTVTGPIQGTGMKMMKRMTMTTMRMKTMMRMNIRMEEGIMDDTKMMKTEEAAAVAAFRGIITGKQPTGTMIAVQSTIVPEVDAVVPATVVALILDQITGAQVAAPADKIVTARAGSSEMTAAIMGIPAVLDVAAMAAAVQVDSIVTAKAALQATAVAITVTHPVAVHPDTVPPAEVLQTVTHPVAVHPDIVPPAEALQTVTHPVAVHPDIVPPGETLQAEVHPEGAHLAEKAPPVQGAVLPAKIHGPFGLSDGPFFYF